MLRPKPDISIETLENALEIDETALEECSARQAVLFHRVAKSLVLAMSRRDAAKQAVAEAEAECDKEIRETAEAAGDKITEKAIESQKVLDPDVKQARKELLDLTEQMGLWGALKESFQQRSYALNHLVDLHIAGYFGDPNHTDTSLKGMMARRNKVAMAQQRKRHRHEQ